MTDKKLLEQQHRDGGADDEQEHYCRECGSDRLDYVEQYANGREYKCSACGNVQMC